MLLYARQNEISVHSDKVKNPEVATLGFSLCLVFLIKNDFNNSETKLK